MSIVEDVTEGLQKGEFFLEYLPTVSLADGRCLGGEALVRWKRPEGVIMPDDFIPHIDNSVAAGLLTYWVVETVSTEMSDWLWLNTTAHMAINVPPVILGRGGLPYAGEKSGLYEFKKQIILELAERGLPDSLGLDGIEYASKQGLRIALDDCTLSGANLAILARYPLDILKLDRTLIAQISPDNPQPTWLAGLRVLLAASPFEVIAEGVETNFQAETLRAAGIAMAQGFHFSRPLVADRFRAFYSQTLAGGNNTP